MSAYFSDSENGYANLFERFLHGVHAIGTHDCFQHDHRRDSVVLNSAFGVHARFFAVHTHVEPDILIVSCGSQRKDEADNFQQHETDGAAVDNGSADSNGLRQ